MFGAWLIHNIMCAWTYYLSRSWVIAFVSRFTTPCLQAVRSVVQCPTTALSEQGGNAEQGGKDCGGFDRSGKD